MAKEKLSAKDNLVKDKAILKQNEWRIVVPEVDIHTTWQEGEDFAKYGLGNSEFAFHPEFSVVKGSEGGTYQEHKYAIEVGLSKKLAQKGINSPPVMATAQECVRAYLAAGRIGIRLFDGYYVRTKTMTNSGKNVLVGSPTIGDGICFAEGLPERGYKGLPGGEHSVRAFAVVRLK